MAAGAGAGDGEIDHLGSEYEGAQDPHERDSTVIHVLLELP
jgi:hypothetical protein